MELLRDAFSSAIFTPEIVYGKNDIYKQIGEPTGVQIYHGLVDGTILKMDIRCYGFPDNESWLSLKSTNPLGFMCPEIQTMPNWQTVITFIERAGRQPNVVMEHVIDGVPYRLSGERDCKIVLCDVNVPARSECDWMYRNYYDDNDKHSNPIHECRLPAPVIPISELQATEEEKERYPRGKYRNKDVIWKYNPKAFWLRAHKMNEDGDPDSAYEYIIPKLRDGDSAIQRYVLGEPETVASGAAIYQFDRESSAVCTCSIVNGLPIYVGYDPGTHAALVLCQLVGDEMAVFKEFIFDRESHVSTRSQFFDFFAPWCEENIAWLNGGIMIIPDPAAAALGKGGVFNSTDSTLSVAIECSQYLQSKDIHATVVPTGVRNQDLQARKSSIEYFLNQGKFKVDRSCETIIKGLSGGYHYKVLKGGLVSSDVDKMDDSCDAIEALQYVGILMRKHMSNEVRSKGKKKLPTRVKI
jgi:hypothetical protein